MNRTAQIFAIAVAVAASVSASVYLRRINVRLDAVLAMSPCTLTDLAGPEMAAAYQAMAGKLTGRK